MEFSTCSTAKRVAQVSFGGGIIVELDRDPVPCPIPVIIVNFHPDTVIALQSIKGEQNNSNPNRAWVDRKIGKFDFFT